MTTLLNIGLHIHGDHNLTPNQVICEVRKLAKLVRVGYYQSDSEPTMVIEVGRTMQQHEVFFLAEELHQGAIAYMSDEAQFLSGPTAHIWGPFDPAKFILPDGRRADGQRVLSR